MKKLLALLFLAVVAGGLIFAYREMSAERKREAEHEGKIAPPPRVARTNDLTVVTLDLETQQRIGLKIEALTAATMPRELKGYGRVLDPAPLVALLVEQAAARATLEVATKEFNRLKTLAADQNASIRALEAQEAVAKQAQLALEAVQAKLIVGWGTVLAERTDLAELVQALAVQDAALVRVDLPAGETASPTGLRLATLTRDTAPFDAPLLGPARSVEPLLQGQGFLALVRPNPARLAPGVALTAFLQLPGEPMKGVIVPCAAVLRSEGRAWVFVRSGADRFTRREIATDTAVPDGWFISSGLAPDDKVVTGAAQVLLSEELKATIQMAE